MDVKINIKKANSKMFQLTRSDGMIMYVDTNVNKWKRLTEFLRGKEIK